MDATAFYCFHNSPWGDLLLTSDGEALTGLYLPSSKGNPGPQPGWRREEVGALRQTGEQLRAYFDGKLQAFDLPLNMAGTDFQRVVWRELRNIGYGEIISYAELARRVDRPGAARAVGAANGRNPISIVVPCHRVIGADGTLTGYGGGLDRKEWLLRHEVEVLGKGAPAPPAKQPPRARKS